MVAVMPDEPKARSLRWARWLVSALVTLEVAYVAAGNSFLHHAWGRNLINRRPDRLSVSWDRGWTWLPGVVRIETLDVEGTSRRVAWKVRMDRGTMLVWLPSLALRHFDVLWGRPEGAEVDVEVLPPPEERKAPTRKRGWRVTLGGLGVEDLRRIRVGAYELAGSGRLDGKASFQVRGPMELHLDRLSFDGAEVTSAGTVVATGLDIDGGFDTEPFRPGQDRVADLLGGASGRARLGAHVQNLGFLTAYLRTVPWVGLGGVGHLELALELDEGSLLPGSSLSLSGPEVRADFFDFHARGAGRVAGEVPKEGGELRLRAVLEEYSVTRLSDGAQLLVGKDLETSFVSRSTNLREPPADVAGSLHVPPARVASLVAFARYLPASTTATVTGGSAELSVDLSYDTGAAGGKGNLLIDAKDVSGTFGDAEISGDLRLEADLPSVDLLAGAFDVSGTEVSIANARMVRNGKERTRNWWGRLEVTSGNVQRHLLAEGGGLQKSEPALVVANLQGRLFDSAPLVVLMEQRLPKLGWFDRLLTIPEIELLGRVTLEGPSMGLEGVRVTGGEENQLEIRAELDLAGEETSGAVYARYHAIDAALALEQGDRDWRLLRAKQAYEAAAAAYRSGGGGPR
jgi:hypothetical protein